jgi:hypothetical protein
MSIQAHVSASPSVPAFLMLNAEIREPEAAPAGHYDPETQCWTGTPTPLGAGTYSSRSNGSKGGYSYQSDD